MEPCNEQHQTPELDPWQPLTFKGVARFSRTTISRLGFVFLVASAMSGIILAWFIDRAYLPVIDDAVSRLPDQLALRDGRLENGEAEDQVLAENNHLAIVIATDERASIGQLADLQWELRPREIWIGSLFGYLKLAYPVAMNIPLDRLNVEPWWKARRPYLAAGMILVTMVGLPIFWAALAALLAGPIWIWAWMLKRQATLRGCWQLSGAALIPGNLWVGGVVIAYALHFMNLVGVLVFFGLHLVVDLIYLLMAPVFLPGQQLSGAHVENPFGSPAAELKSKANPFRP